MVGTWTPIGWAWVPVMERGGGYSRGNLNTYAFDIYIFTILSNALGPSKTPFKNYRRG